MSNSSLVNYTKISPSRTSPRQNTIKKITIHHMAGNASIEECGNLFANPNRQASSNYGIGTDGRVGLYVEEKDRAWTSGSRDNDNQAITIEVANDGGAPDWHVSDKAYAKLIDLCVDICRRNGIDKLNFTGDASGNLTMHKYFQATVCPGPYLESKFGAIAEEVNKRLSKTSVTTRMYKVQVGAFTTKRYADNFKKKVKSSGFNCFVTKVGKYYKVQVGAFTSKANAEKMLSKLKNAGYSDAFITFVK